MRLEIAVAARTHHRERIAAPRGFDLHFLDGFLQRFGVVERADVDAREAAQRLRVEGGDAGLEIDGSDAVLLAFLDLEGDQEALLVGIVFGQRGHDLHVGKAVLEIVAPDQVAVGLDPIRIVDVVAAEEAQQVRFARLDDVLEAIGRIGLLPMNSIDLTPVLLPSVIVNIRSTRLFGCSMISGVTRTS